jgi:hypothetical protein
MLAARAALMVPSASAATSDLAAIAVVPIAELRDQAEEEKVHD